MNALQLRAGTTEPVWIFMRILHACALNDGWGKLVIHVSLIIEYNIVILLNAAKCNHFII